jgi:Na+/phosphate symporter
MLSYIGLVLIILGWLIQFLNKNKDIQFNFVLVYVIGVALLSVDILREGLTTLGILQLVSFLTACAVLIKIRK